MSCRKASGTAVSKNQKSKEQHRKQEELTNIFHPLKNSWTLWYFEPDRNKSWEDSQNKVSTFKTVEDFWSIFSHIRKPSESKASTDYSLFKEHIRPMWEDKANKYGGRWIMTLMRNENPDLNHYWIDTLLCLIGEIFDHHDEVCGAVVNIRQKGNKIAVWTSSSKNKEAVMEIGRKLKEELNLPDRIKFQYQIHSDYMAKNSSNIRAMYEI